MTCLLNAAFKNAKEGVLEKYVQSAVVEKWGLKIAQGATAITAGLEGLTTAETTAAIVFLAVVTILGAKIDDGETQPAAVGKVSIPKVGFGAVVAPPAECAGSKDKAKDSVGN
jgi:hypothetical protein